MKQPQHPIEDIEELFDDADQDNDDQISLTEFRGLMLTLGRNLRDDAIAANFQKIDANHDGRIGFDEFRTWWLRA
jgi:Ca2+-binding EF-hand superfamily protein